MDNRLIFIFYSCERIQCIQINTFIYKSIYKKPLYLKYKTLCVVFLFFFLPSFKSRSSVSDGVQDKELSDQPNMRKSSISL